MTPTPQIPSMPLRVVIAICIQLKANLIRHHPVYSKDYVGSENCPLPCSSLSLCMAISMPYVLCNLCYEDMSFNCSTYVRRTALIMNPFVYLQNLIQLLGDGIPNRFNSAFLRCCSFEGVSMPSRALSTPLDNGSSTPDPRPDHLVPNCFSSKVFG